MLWEKTLSSPDQFKDCIWVKPLNEGDQQRKPASAKDKEFVSRTGLLSGRQKTFVQAYLGLSLQCCSVLKSFAQVWEAISMKTKSLCLGLKSHWCSTLIFWISPPGSFASTLAPGSYCRQKALPRLRLVLWVISAIGLGRGKLRKSPKRGALENHWIPKAFFPRKPIVGLACLRFFMIR